MECVLRSNGKRYPVVLEQDKTKIYFRKSPFALKSEIKCMKGSRWNPDQRMWTVKRHPRNLFQLRAMMVEPTDENPYEWFERPLVELEATSRPLKPHQIEMIAKAMTYRYQLFAADMGCISGDAVVHVNRAGRGFKTTLRELHNKLSAAEDHGGKRGQNTWDSSIPTMVRSLKGETLGLNQCMKSLYKGEKPVVRVTLDNGKSVVCTPDHPICVGFDQYVEAQSLSVGDTVLTNGRLTDKDGYIRLQGPPYTDHHRYTTGGVYEHILVAEKTVGRKILVDEHVHHLNGVKHDNRPENLQVMPAADHARTHSDTKRLHLDTAKCKFVPEPAKVVSVEDAGVIDVYDLVMADPHRNFVADSVVVHNCGKTLTAIEIMERMVKEYGWLPECPDKIWFVGPKSALESVELDMVKWSTDVRPRMMTYERFMLDYEKLPTPQVIFFDESTSLKNPNSLRARAAQEVTDNIRAEFGTDGMVIALSGSPTAKRPSDIWSQAEITWPGFLREGSIKAFEERYANVVEKQDLDGNRFRVIESWNEHEVDKLPARLKGLMTVYRKSEILNLPERHFVTRHHEPSARIKRIAKQLVEMAPNAITALTWCRALSSGFQYKEDEASENGDRPMVETKCPKDDTLREILDEEESRGRMICFASFQGSIDRVRRICLERGWDVITIDGRGWNCYSSDGSRLKDDALTFWANNPKRTVVVGNPASCRFGLTLVEAKTIVYFDQNFSAEHRLQSMDRNYRIGQDSEVRVIDLLHLPIDELILETLQNNQKMEHLSLGILMERLGQ